MAVSTATTQTKPAHAGLISLDFSLVRAGGLGFCRRDFQSPEFKLTPIQIGSFPVGSLLHQEMPGWKAAIASFTQSGGYANLGNRIAQVNHPTLILWGEADDVFYNCFNSTVELHPNL